MLINTTRKKNTAGNQVLLIRFLILSMLTFLTGYSIAGKRKDTLHFPEDSNQNRQFFLLNEKYEYYKTIENAGGWVRLENIKRILFPGTKDPFIQLLRKRLEQEGYTVKVPALKTDSFDLPLQNLLKQFQKNHGLDTNGTTDKATIAELNVSVAKRTKQISLNLARWKKFKPTSSFYIFVNIAGFYLEVMENDSCIVSMKIIAGKPTRQTPEFSAQMKFIVFNPSWNIPPGILKRDILPELERDKNYLARKQMSIFITGQNGTRKKITADSVNLTNSSGQKIKYEILQAPGANNPMGEIKFMFPNRYNVYMHDTPSKKLFDRNTRAFSSGCIRLSKATELAVSVLKKDSSMYAGQTEELIRSKKTKTIYLMKPVEVITSYMTAWVNKSGELQFRKDIYQKDN